MGADEGVRALQRKTAAAGAALLVIAFATGGLLASAMTRSVDADVHAISAAHLNAIFGCLWLVALAATLPWLRFSLRGSRRLVYVTVLAASANWGITVIKAFLHVAGVGLTGDRANDLVFGALGAAVVLPSFAAAIGWLYGLVGPRPAS